MEQFALVMFDFYSREKIFIDIYVCYAGNVLHNILIDLHDKWSEEKRWWKEEEQEEYYNQFLNLSRLEQIEETDKEREVKHLALN